MTLYMNSNKEASARIKINKLLEESGWRFEDSEKGKANIKLEPGVRYKELGDDFENQGQGFIDFLLLDKNGRSLVVVEAKRESINPLSAKEQAKVYARNVGARFIILSNGNIHYFWDTKHGNPDTISRFPTQESITQYETYIPNPLELANTSIDENYIIESQMPNYSSDPMFLDESTRNKFLKENNLKQMRPYQVQAIKALQNSAKENKNRFLFEMATGTGKTLISAGVIRLFLKSGNARRILFLVDRLELEDQAYKAFKNYLGKDYNCVIYKDARDSWTNAHIVVSTIQTFQAGDRYKKEFSPTDFELVISDEAHRSIGGNSRAVFEYFVGYKLGLTATPKDYLRGFDDKGLDTQREFEKRQLLDTYKTFGCDSGEPTFRYDLLSGVKDGFLINPVVIDARTEITTQLLSDQGLSIKKKDIENGDISEEIFTEKQYEKKLFNEETNVVMCKAFLDNGFLDPVADSLGVKLFGKSIVFCVSQNHAAKITNILNKLAMEKWPDLYYESDFAMQVTSQVKDAQQMTINFSDFNNKLGGKVKKPEGYDSSKTRVAVTVGMMTTGYDCQDLLNIALMRPVFSPSDFVQIKGRGTRKYTFEYRDYENNDIVSKNKEKFKFFDYFATCEYFENEFPYDEKIRLPRPGGTTEIEPPIDTGIGGDGPTGIDKWEGNIDLATNDNIKTINESVIGESGMRIDREGFKRAVQEDVLSNEVLSNLWNNGDEIGAEEYTKTHIFNKPSHFLNLDKIKKAFSLDRNVSVREFLQVAFGQKDSFEMKDDLLESEWSKFTEINPVDQEHYASVKSFFKAYIVDEEVRDIIKSNELARFYNCPAFDFEEYQRLNGFREVVPSYVRDYVSLNTYMN